MIEVRNGRIFFFNNLKQELKVLDFKCLSAYVCPTCLNVLQAYYVGRMVPESLKEYMEKDTLKYAYEMGDTEGGQWLSIQPYAHKEVCRWEVVGSISRGIENAVESFLQIHETKVKNNEAFITAISSGTMLGFTVVKDEIGADLPMLLYNQSNLTSLEDLSLDDKWDLLKDLGKLIDAKLSASRKV